MPLPLQAVLGEFELSLGQLEGLRPGDEIPLAIPVELPLRVGGEVFAHGRIGTFDNRMALRLTRLGGALTQPREIAA
jgi:flagellar motor switch/type III secretory pathway protein FliN